jgi:hypothetical protein|nr:hypothetical protein [Oxalobacteraceae bacterium]
MTTTRILLADVQHGVPSGNYDGSSLDWYSDAQEAADYYRGRGSIQTVTFRVQGFVGLFTVEATLDSLIETATWFDLVTYGDLITPLTDYHPVTITGNFVWLRLRIEDFEAGTIEYVTVSY